MVPMNGIRQVVMTGVHGTGRFMYTCYRYCPFSKQEIMLFVKNNYNYVYREYH